MSDAGPTPPERPEPWTEDRSGAPAPDPTPGAQPEAWSPSVLDPPTVLTPAPEPPAAPQPPATVLLDPVPARRPMRLRTVVFGLALLTVAALTLVGTLTGVRLSPSLIAVVLLVGAGFVLVLGGLSAAVRESVGRSQP